MANNDMFHAFSEKEFSVWLAGFFDGEGCIYIPRAGLVLSLSSTDRRVIYSIASKAGLGTVSRVDFINQPGWRPKFTWRIGNYRDSLTTLLRMRPFLTIKRQKAELALAKIRAYQRHRAALDRRNRLIVRLVSRGWKQKRIAIKLGMTRSNVSQIVGWVREHGHTPRPHGPTTKAHQRWTQTHRKIPARALTTSSLVRLGARNK